jgi:competence protein ComEA
MLRTTDRALPSPTELRYEVDLNRADWTELVNLPGIGEARAREIVRDREERGPFATPSDLMRVHGIGPATIEGIREHLCRE